MATYGLRTFDADGKAIVDISTRLTKILWDGVIKFPNDVPTGPNWPNASNFNFNGASRSVTVQSSGFLDGTPFVISNDFNVVNTHEQMGGIKSGVSWKMVDATTMSIVYTIFSPGWSRQQILDTYPNFDIPVMVGVY